MKRGRDGPISARAQAILNDFIFLETTLHSFEMKGDLAAFSRAKDAVELLSGRSFNLEDLSVLIEVWSGAYSLSWRLTKGDGSTASTYELYLAANHTPEGEVQSGKRTPNGRIDEFRYKDILCAFFSIASDG
jgi:DNA replication factor CDT1 like